MSLYFFHFGILKCKFINWNFWCVLAHVFSKNYRSLFVLKSRGSIPNGVSFAMTSVIFFFYCESVRREFIIIRAIFDANFFRTIHIDLVNHLLYNFNKIHNFLLIWDIFFFKFLWILVHKLLRKTDRLYLIQKLIEPFVLT